MSEGGDGEDEPSGGGEGPPAGFFRPLDPKIWRPASGFQPAEPAPERSEDPFAAFKAKFGLGSGAPVPPAPPAPAPSADPASDPDEGAWDVDTSWLDAPADADSESGSGDPGDLRRLRAFTVVDRSGFDRPLDVLTLLVPAQWEAAGGVRWVMSPDVPANGTQVWAYAVSPQKGFGFELFPGFTWVPSLLGVPALGAVAYLMQVLFPKVRGGASDVQVLGEESFPDLARAMCEDGQAQAAALGMQLQVDAARVHVRYTLGGRSWEEWFQVALESYTFGGMFGGGAISAPRALGFRAPAGQLEALRPLAATVAASLRGHPEWQARVDEVHAKINRIGREGAAERARIMADAQEEVSEIHRGIFRRQQESSDRRHRKFVQQIREVETWVDPSSGLQLELSQGHKQAWSNGLDEVIVSDDVNFDPNATTLPGRWRKLRRAPALFVTEERRRER